MKILKMKINKSVIVIFFFFVYFTQKLNSSYIQLKNQQSSNCVFGLSDGNMVDMNVLRRNTDYMFPVGRYIYKANFCGTQIDRCSGLLIPASIYIRPSLCISKLTFEWSPKIEYISENNKNLGIKLNFPPGEKCFMSAVEYKLTYYLNCDLNKEIEFTTIKKISTCIYEYHFATKHACYDNFISESFWSPKKVLFVLISSFLFYCIGFSFMNYRRNPDDGVIKALPHRDFWVEFVDNAMLGSRVISRKIKEKLLQYRTNQVGYN